jgi:phosphoglycolate phosphatase
MNVRSKYPLVIFDFDGTLADSLPCLAGILNRLARQHHFREIRDDEREQLRTLDTLQLIRALGMPLWKLPAILLQVRTLMAAEIRMISLFPGVAPMLMQLADCGARLALVSSNSWANIEVVLGPELAQLFTDIECEATLFGKRSKLRRVLRTAKLTADQAIYIGDELRDQRAAQAEKIAFGAVTWGHTPIEQFRSHQPAFLFQSREDLLSQLIGP